MRPIEPIKQEEVFVDVQPWLKALYEQLPDEGTPLNGVFRHADLLCKYFRPVAVVLPGETHHTLGCVERLETYLKRKILLIEREPFAEIWTLEETIQRAGCKVWLSIAPDCTGPAIVQPHGPNRDYLAACIVHDVQAAERTFGQVNKSNFLRAMELTDIWLPVSEKAKTDFHKLWTRRTTTEETFNVKLQPPFFIPYACTHGLDSCPMLSPRNGTFSARGNLSVSLHSIYPHKNLFGLSEFVEWAQSTHLHIGAFMKPNEREILHCIVQSGIHFTGRLSDTLAEEILREADVFVCLSYEEGFSMPAMEAILYGVPRIVLSDIPAHREIYGGTHGVVFVDPARSSENSLRDQDIHMIADLPKVTEKDRWALYDTYQPVKVLQKFQEWLADPVC